VQEPDVVCVELVPRMVPIDGGERARRGQVAARLGELGHIDPATGEVPELVAQGWLARIGDAEFPVLGYGVEPADGAGRAVVSLAVAADHVVVGYPPRETPPVGVPQERPVSYWGAPPSLAAQVAANAQAVQA
jgi:hypothetical protein